MSEFIAKQVEAKQKAWHEAKALLESSAARNNEWTGEDEAKFAELNAEIDRRNTAIELEQREAKVVEQLQASAINFKDASVSDNEGDILRKMAAGEIRGYEFPMEKRITGSSTGAPVPTGFVNEIVKVARLVNPLLDYATVLNTASGENLQVPSQAGFSTAAIVGQGSTAAVSEPTFNSLVTLSAYKAYALAQLSRELILDSGVDIVGFLAEQFGNAFGNFIGDKVVNGTGTVEPTGFLTAAATGVTGATGTAGAFTAANVIDLVYSLDGALRSKPSFAMLANSTSIAALRKLQDGSGRFIFDVGVGLDKRDLVLGVPVIETPAMPSPGTGVRSLAVGDLKSLYIRNAGGLQVDRSDDWAFNADLSTWRATWRFDSRLIQTNNIKVFRGGAS